MEWGGEFCDEAKVFLPMREPDSSIVLTWGKKEIKQNGGFGASLVAQWLRVCLLMQGTRVRALAWEDPTCRRAAGPVSHNC